MTLLWVQCTEASGQRSEKCARCERTLNTFHAHMLVCVLWRMLRRWGSVVCLSSGWFVLWVFGSVYSGQDLQKQKAGLLLSLATTAISKRQNCQKGPAAPAFAFSCSVSVFPFPSGVFSCSTVNWQKVLLSCVSQCWFSQVSFRPHLMFWKHSAPCSNSKPRLIIHFID